MGSIYSMWRYNPQGNWAKMFIVYNLDLLSAASPLLVPEPKQVSVLIYWTWVAQWTGDRAPIRAWSEHNTVCHMVRDHFMSSTQVTLSSLGTQRADSNEPMYHMYILGWWQKV